MKKYFKACDGTHNYQLLIITPITHVYAVVRTVDSTPIFTQKEVESIKEKF